MEKQNVTVGVFKSHEAAEEGVKDLQKSGFDMTKLSIIGKDYHTEEHVIGFYNTGDRVKAWGKLGAFWGGFFGLLFGSAFLVIPVLGHVIVFGPLVSWMISALEGAVVAGGFSALGGALYSVGIPKESVVKYENAVKASQFVVIAHGTIDEVNSARVILDNAKADEVAVHYA
ncbi:MAG TPA: general stress protein [Chlorobaculum sp.]|nr:general stress protein [Chlorobaculum sp.]